ncbi:MAG: zinc metalloprotease HtpX [Candidatus Aenigmatarchaeota archaeon]
MALKLWLTMSLTLVLLFGFLFGLLAALGYFFNISGYIIVAIAVLLVLIQWWIGPKIIWWTTNMRLLEKDEYPWIWETVKELCKKNKVPMPKIALARVGAPNAFVFGRTPSSAVLTITQGLLNNLTQEEVKAVIAHEIGHIKHKDMIVMTVVSVIPIIAYFVAEFLISASYRARDRRRDIGAAILVGIGAYVVYLISNLLVLALSRFREYYADRFSGINTKPKLLASALAKITYGLSMSSERIENSSVRSFFIADPISAATEVNKLASEYSDLNLDEKELEKAMEWEKKNLLIRVLEISRTHPLTFKRILALKELEKELAKS